MRIYIEDKLNRYIIIKILTVKSRRYFTIMLMNSPSLYTIFAAYTRMHFLEWKGLTLHYGKHNTLTFHFEIEFPKIVSIDRSSFKQEAEGSFSLF